VTDEFERLAFEAGLPPIRLHDLRHGAATLHLAAGVDMKVISAMLRHSSITITADTYTSVVPEIARAAAEAAAAIVPLTGRAKKSRAAHSAGKKKASGTPRLPIGSHGAKNTTGRSSQRKNAQLRKGAPPGTRTPDPLIKNRLKYILDSIEL
jgi:hypothetical protein